MNRAVRHRLCCVLATLGVISACGGVADTTSSSSGGSSGSSGASSSGSSGSGTNEAGVPEACPSSTGCPLPAGLSCPTPESPQLSGTASPVSRACTGDGDCASVIFQSDCCGNTFALGVSTASVAPATAAASTCRSGFPGCGCPATPTVAETGTPDGGGFDVPIEAYCAAGTCKTRYR